MEGLKYAMASSAAEHLLLNQVSCSHYYQKEEHPHLAGQAGDLAIRANDKVGLGAVQVDVIRGQRVAILPGKGLRLRNPHMPPAATAAAAQAILGLHMQGISQYSCCCQDPWSVSTLQLGWLRRVMRADCLSNFPCSRRLQRCCSSHELPVNALDKDIAIFMYPSTAPEHTFGLTCRFADGVTVCWEEAAGWLAAELDSACVCGA